MLRNCCVVVLLMMIISASAEMQPGDQTCYVRSTYDGTEQPYRLFVPDAKKECKPLPLLVVLHGKWVDYNAWFDYTPVKEYAQKYGYIVVAPHGRGDYFYRGAGEQDVLDIIHRVKTEHSIDDNRVYLMGHSMGGWGSWWIGLRHPDLFAAICPMAGFPPMQLLPNALHLAPFIIHSEDDPAVPISNSRRPAEKLAELGISFQYREEHGYGHRSKMIGDNFDRLFEWLNLHRRVTRPDRIRFITRTPKNGKAYWLTILETIKYPDYAEIKANIDEENMVTIETDNINQFGISLDDIPLRNGTALRVKIDDGIYEITGSGRFVVLKKDVNLDNWQIKYLTAERLPVWESRVLCTIPGDNEIITSTSLLASAASKIICEQTGAELCLFLDDMFQFPGGALTEDDALDLYVYPEERLALISYTGESLPEHLTMKSRLYPEGKYDRRLRKIWTVAAPMILAEKMRGEMRKLPEPISTYILRGLRGRPLEK